jgi:hypothetical protein
LWRLDKDCVEAKLVLSLSNTSRCSLGRGLFYVAFHPSAPYLATPSADGAVLWRLGKDCSSAQDISLLRGQGFYGLPDVVYSVAFHPSASFVATGTQDGTVKLWRLNQSYCDAVCVQKLQRHDGPIHSVVFHASAPLIATAGSDGTADVWSFDADRSELTHVTTLHGHSYSVYCVAFHPSAPFLVTGSGDGQAKLWFVGPQRADAACVSTMRGLGGPVRSVAFRPSAACIAAGSDFRRGEALAVRWRVCEGFARHIVLMLAGALLSMPAEGGSLHRLVTAQLQMNTPLFARDPNSGTVDDNVFARMRTLIFTNAATSSQASHRKTMSTSTVCPWIKRYNSGIRMSYQTYLHEGNTTKQNQPINHQSHRC